jgi:hypothetical protein
VVTGANSFVMAIKAIRSKIKVFSIISVSRLILLFLGVVGMFCGY